MLKKKTSNVNQLPQLTGFIPDTTPTYPAKLTVLYTVFPFFCVVKKTINT